MMESENLENKDILEKITEFIANISDTRTDKQFWEDAGINERTFYRYKKKYHDYIYDQAEIRRKKYMPALRNLGYRALSRRLAKSDNAAKLLFQLLGDLVERSEVKTEILTVEQKRERLSNLMHDLRMKQLNPSMSPNRTELPQDQSKHES